MGAPYKAILLDIDGTLIDSNDAHARAWVDAFNEAGIEMRYDRVLPLIGMGGDHLIPALTNLTKDEGLGKKIDLRRGEIFRKKYLPKLKAFPKTRELLLEFQKRGFELVVATSASEEDLNALLRQGHLEDILLKTTSSKKAAASKPEPDIIRAAQKKAGVQPPDALMIGDTPYDIEAAQQANIDCIAFTCGGWEPEELLGAIEVWESPEHLLKNLEASVLVLEHSQQEIPDRRDLGLQFTSRPLHEP